MNVPNLLSVIRICLVPVFVLVYFGDYEGSSYCAAAIYAVASFTDVLDGRIARKYRLTTNLGRILDPLGDKLMTLAVIICITIDEVIPVWAVIAFFVKEGLMGIGGGLLYKRLNKMPPSNYFGKLSTVVFFVVCIILMLFSNIPANIAVILISAALIIMLIAFISYIVSFVRLSRDNKSIQQ